MSTFAERPTRLQLALHTAEDEGKRLKPKNVLSINVDLSEAVSTARACLIELEGLRISGAAAGLGVEALIASLTTYADALLCITLRSADSPLVTPELMGEARTLHARFKSVCEVLAISHRARKQKPKARPIDPRVALVSELLELSCVLCVRPEFANAVGIDARELENAERLGNRLLVDLYRDELAERDALELVDTKRRIFTLLVRAYDQARRIFTFVRWNQGDVDRFAPSLYVKRTPARRRKDKADADMAEADTDQAPFTQTSATHRSMAPDSDAHASAAPGTRIEVVSSRELERRSQQRH